VTKANNSNYLLDGAADRMITACCCRHQLSRDSVFDF